MAKAKGATCAVCGRTCKDEELAETNGKCPSCGLLIRLPAPEGFQDKRLADPFSSSRGLSVGRPTTRPPTPLPAESPQGAAAPGSAEPPPHAVPDESDATAAPESPWAPVGSDAAPPESFEEPWPSDDGPAEEPYEAVERGEEGPGYGPLGRIVGALVGLGAIVAVALYIVFGPGATPEELVQQEPQPPAVAQESDLVEKAEASGQTEPVVPPQPFEASQEAAKPGAREEPPPVVEPQGEQGDQQPPGSAIQAVGPSEGEPQEGPIQPTTEPSEPADQAAKEEPGPEQVEMTEPAAEPEPPAPVEPKIAKSLEEVSKAIVKFEVPAPGGARVQYGCGFLVDPRGWIATTYHVVAGASSDARVTFADGTECKLAGIVVQSPEHDLAVVQLEEPPADLTILDTSCQDTPRLGAQVYAFGHPYNADFSLSRGIVSRVLTTADLLASPQSRIVAAMKAPHDLVWIQHDAKISPGNSGGPLLKEDGQVIGINAFVHLKAEFGYASDVRYLREVLATASEQVTPLPPPQPLARAPDGTQPQLRPGQVVVSTGRMKQLFDEISGFQWTPQELQQYHTLAELARQMTVAKHLEVSPGKVRLPPQAVQGLVGFADQVFGQIRAAGWTQQRSKAINQFAADRVDKVGEGAMVVTTVLGSVPNGILLQVQGTEKRFLVPVGRQQSQFSRGTHWLVIGLVSPQTARLKIRNQPETYRIPVMMTHYMLKVR